jgi:hypothetical protein
MVVEPPVQDFDMNKSEELSKEQKLQEKLILKE